MRRNRHSAKDRAKDARLNVPYIKRNVPYFDFLSEEGLQKIEEHSDWILKEVGVTFLNSPHALKLWKQAGADVKGDRVRLDKGMARALCKTIPSEFTQHARNAKKSVRIGGNNTVFACVYGPPFVQCLDKGRRYGNLEDFEKLAKLASMLPAVHHQGLVICEPCDIPVNKRHLDMLYAHMRYSDKPFLGAITERKRAEQSMDMARILFGADFMENNCVIMGNVNTNSPLLVDKVVTDAIEVYCGGNQGIVVAPFILGGAMGPVSTAASIAQALAEAMICGAYTQLVKRGAPFVMGNFLSSMNLKSGAPTFGMPEPVMSHYVIGQLARRLNVPLRSGGSLTSSKLPDAQAAAESSESLHSAVLGGANFVLHAAGWLESGLSTSFEKLIIDADRLASLHIILDGISLDEDSFAKDAYLEIEPGGHFLGTDHTMRHYETAYFASDISDSDSFEQWELNGSKDAMTRANERWKKLLNDYTLPPMDDSMDEALKDYIARTKSSVPDAWY